MLGSNIINNNILNQNNVKILSKESKESKEDSFTNLEYLIEDSNSNHNIDIPDESISSEYDYNEQEREDNFMLGSIFSVFIVISTILCLPTIFIYKLN